VPRIGRVVTQPVERSRFDDSFACSMSCKYTGRQGMGYTGRHVRRRARPDRRRRTMLEGVKKKLPLKLVRPLAFGSGRVMLCYERG
jgi:hypothetical protein